MKSSWITLFYFLFLSGSALAGEVFVETVASGSMVHCFPEERTFDGDLAKPSYCNATIQLKTFRPSFSGDLEGQLTSNTYTTRGILSNGLIQCRGNQCEIRGAQLFIRLGEGNRTTPENLSGRLSCKLSLPSSSARPGETMRCELQGETSARPLAVGWDSERASTVSCLEGMREVLQNGAVRKLCHVRFKLKDAFWTPLSIFSPVPFSGVIYGKQGEYVGTLSDSMIQCHLIFGCRADFVLFEFEPGQELSGVIPLDAKSGSLTCHFDDQNANVVAQCSLKGAVQAAPQK